MKRKFSKNALAPEGLHFEYISYLPNATTDVALFTYKDYVGISSISLAAGGSPLFVTFKEISLSAQSGSPMLSSVTDFAGTVAVSLDNPSALRLGLGGLYNFIKPIWTREIYIRVPQITTSFIWWSYITKDNDYYQTRGNVV